MDLNSILWKVGAIIAVVVLLRIVWMVIRPRLRGAFGETLLAAVLRRNAGFS